MTRVLYIEDEPNNRMLVRRLFMAMASDLVYVESDNARAGIQMAIETPPDLILMDISMPDMDGLTATGVIRKTDSIKDMPIIALTANAMEGDRERFLAAGCDGYISKPIDIDTFIDNVRDYIKRIPEIKSKWASKTIDEQNGVATGTQTRPVTQSTRPKDLDAAIAAMSAAKSPATPPAVTPTPTKPAPPVPSATSQPVQPAAPVPSASAPAAPSATPPAKPAEPTPTEAKPVTPAVTPTPQAKSVEPAPVVPLAVAQPEAKPAASVPVTNTASPVSSPPSSPAPPAPSSGAATPAQPIIQQGTVPPAPTQTPSPSAEASAPVTPKSQDAVEPQAASTPAKVEETSAKQQELSSNGGGQ